MFWGGTNNESDYKMIKLTSLEDNVPATLFYHDFRRSDLPEPEAVRVIVQGGVLRRIFRLWQPEIMFCLNSEQLADGKTIGSTLSVDYCIPPSGPILGKLPRKSLNDIIKKPKKYYSMYKKVPPYSQLEVSILFPGSKVLNVMLNINQRYLTNPPTAATVIPELGGDYNPYNDDAEKAIILPSGRIIEGSMEGSQQVASIAFSYGYDVGNISWGKRR